MSCRENKVKLGCSQVSVAFADSGERLVEAGIKAGWPQSKYRQALSGLAPQLWLSLALTSESDDQSQAFVTLENNSLCVFWFMRELSIKPLTTHCTVPTHGD